MFRILGAMYLYSREGAFGDLCLVVLEEKGNTIAGAK